jgi:hypothetical protein
MVSPVDDRGIDAFLDLLGQGGKGPGPKSEALEALALRPVFLATWEPRAEGFRTLINADGEEALAVFSSEDLLKSAASRFDWIEADGSIATHQSLGGDILRHAWTREYAFVVIDIGSDHSLEYEREELKLMLREMDSTGPFRTSRPPAPSEQPAIESSFPPPVERISTMYSMAPTETETLDRLSNLPTKPHEVPFDSEPPTKPRAALPSKRPAPRKQPPTPRQRKSSRPAHKPKSEPPTPQIEEIRVRSAELGDRGTYGAASVIPSSERRPQPMTPAIVVTEDETPRADSAPASAPAAEKLNSDAPTAPAAYPLPSLEPGRLKLPAIGPIGAGPAEPPPPLDTKQTKTKTEKRPAPKGPRVPAPSIGDGIKLVEVHEPPDEALLQSLADVLRGYFEIEWASYCEVARPAGPASPAVGLRITDEYRDNVTAIIKELCEASREHDVEIDVLLIDGHDMLRKAREKAVVFYPWKPKPFGR